MVSTGAKFFSVTYSVTIGGARYVPTVCYRLPTEFTKAVEGMVQNGQAKIYAEEQRFVSGVPYPVKKHTPPAPSSSAPGVNVVHEAQTAKKSAGKKGKSNHRTVKREFE